MTATGDALNQIVPTLVRVAHRPGGVLLRLAGMMVGTFALLGLVYGVNGDSPADWVPLVLAAVLAAPVIVLAVRRERLRVQTEGLDTQQTIGGGQALVIGDGAAADPLREEAEVLSAAMAESAVRTARFLPRVEAAQRAALLAAGGPVNAPYLRDDLRVTLVALLGTLAAVPLGTLGSIITAILLLA